MEQIKLPSNNTETVTDPDTVCNSSIDQDDLTVMVTEQLFSIKAKISRLNDIQNSYEGPPVQDDEECYLLQRVLSEVTELIDFNRQLI